MRALLAIVVIYAVFGGATSSGLLTPQYRVLTLAFLALLVTLWLIVRWWQHWRWYQNPLDVAILLWILVFAFSILTNLDVWRRSVIGLWFALAYIGIWLILQDCIANRSTMRQALLGSLILAGLVVMVIGYDQVLWWFSTWLTGVASGVAPTFEVPRVSSNLDNPNFLGGFLAILLPLALSQLVLLRGRLLRILLVIYCLLAALLLVISDSRGAWIAAGVGLGVLGLLLLARANLLTLERLRSWWQSQARAVKLLLSLGVVAVVFVIALLTFEILRSLGDPGRTVELRTYLFDVGLKMFRQKPLTGWGLFTAGRGLMYFASTPPLTPHATVHDLPINVAAELGVPGLIVLLFTLGLIFVTIRRNWQAATQRDRVLLAGAIGGSVAFSIHHLVDSPTTGSPFLALTCLISLVLATAPIKPIEASVSRRRLSLVVLVAGWVGLLIVAFWNTGAYSVYVNALRYETQSGDPLAATQMMQPAINADPANPIYYLYRGYFYGLGAQSGNGDAVKKAVQDYVHFTNIEPYYSPAWANLSALYEQTGQFDQAFDAMQKAAKLAPDDPVIQFNAGRLYDQRSSQDSDSIMKTSDQNAAQSAYQKALSLSPDYGSDPIWQQTPLRQSTVQTYSNKMSVEAQAVSLLQKGDAAGAQQVLTTAPPVDQQTTEYEIIAEVLALRQADRSTAVRYLNLAKHGSSDWQYDPWVELGISRLAEFDGDQALASSALQTARDLDAENTSSDDNRISAIAYAQYWVTGLAQYYLPQVPLSNSETIFSIMLETGIR